MNKVKNAKCSGGRIALYAVAISALCFAGLILTGAFNAENLVVVKPLQNADAIFVLGGSAEYVERTEKAAELYKSGIAPKIFLTNDGSRGGWNQKEQRNPYFVERARWNLSAQGVPDAAIEILPDVVASTKTEAEAAAKIVRQRNLKSLLLVTSGYHTRRTLAVFERTARRENLQVEFGIEAAQPPADERGETSRFAVAEEYVKLCFYWLFY